MKLALFGANGMAGSRIAQEALMRGHDLSAIVRDRSRFSLSHDRLTIVVGNALDQNNFAEFVKGHDAIISTVGSGYDDTDPVLAYDVIKAAHSLIAGLTRARVLRLVVVGGAGSLEVALLSFCLLTLETSHHNIAQQLLRNARSTRHLQNR